MAQQTAIIDNIRSASEKYFLIGVDCLTCKQDKSPLSSNTWNRKFELQEFDNAPAIGLKCGKASGNLECLDIDNHDGKATERLVEFIELVKPIYEFHNIPIEKTQGGGYHLIYRCEEIAGNLKLASVKKEKDGKIIPDVIFETRGEGGYFVAYPSKGYTIAKNDIFNIPTISKEERRFIHEICKSFNTFIKDVKQTEYEFSEKPGDIYNEMSDAIDNTESLLSNFGWKKQNKTQWCRPGKEKGVSATFGKVAPNVFYVFSTDAHPFENNAAYKPFQVMALLEFNGDFKKCAKHLAEKLNLEPKKRSEIKNNTSHQKEKEAANDMPENDKMALLKRSFIDTDIEYEKPPVIIYIADILGTQMIKKRLMTLGNFSAIIGKAKSRKTFSLSMIVAAAIRNGSIYNKFFGNLPIGKDAVIYFDTEQGLYDSANVIKRIERVANQKSNVLYPYNIREFSPIERCNLIEYALSITPGVGLCIIDGIADLATAINDEEEATRVTGLLLRWTKQYDCHISTVIHQNKNDGYATGHLGSSIMKKAEIVISITKDQTEKNISKVSCDLSRGIDFNEFEFEISEYGLPKVVDKHFENITQTIYHD